MEYYTCIIILTWLTLIGLCILVAENDRILTKDKKSLYITYAVIAFAALAEWLGLKFNGNAAVPVWLLKTVKCADYILTPIAGGALVSQIYRRTVLRKIMIGALVVNAVFQIISVFTGWMLVIDETNVYAHGPLYTAYVGLYLFIIGLVVIEFILYGKNFRKQNLASLLFIILFVVTGIAVQEFTGGKIRTSYITLAIGVAMMFIHNIEFAQLKADDFLNEQRIKLTLSQIQPHFIYNSLSSISELCETDPKRAQKLTDDFAEYLKYNLSALADKRPVPFEKQLEQVGFYLSIEKARFGDRINVVYDIRAEDFKLPTLTIQPLVENAVKHGLCKKDGGGTVTIRSKEEENRYVVEIADDGAGFDVNAPVAAGGTHVGLENVKTRLAYVGCKMEIESRIGEGTTVKITVPKKMRGGGYLFR